MQLQYRFTHLPNTEKALRFRVRGPESGNEAFFNFARPLISVWGNPLEEQLRQLMIAYIRKHGWAKEPVTMTLENTPQNLTNYIIALPKSKK